ncbi:hypothetical protein ETH_00041330 [Eimeria tenella]|uniref:Uncharacterized protein n=1 Tax=Eimeria tenella TaxID=5802 RepID=U6L2J9_EIMTE|nr:hypothetical protein ETH_00041330 [Eimeria tenella]CDJ44622.1 hypothetical protein ETH_00041330 [Eimeria tenella]|eukprot:XP_013235370.1 hypothetical protein ETH_00041330 [Eimeria tenella]
MAFRFRREGQRVKTRVPLALSGFSPFMKELKWEIFEWHYNRHMGPLAVKALMRHQQGKQHPTRGAPSQGPPSWGP